MKIGIFALRSDARALAANFLILALLGLLTSPPLANLFEFLMIVTVLADKGLRDSLCKLWSYKLIRFLFAFFVFMLIGGLYSIASTGEIRHSIFGWLHRLVLLPFALAIFERDEDKERLIKVYGGACAVFASLSFFMWKIGFGFDGEPGVFLRNHATQGMGFAVATMLSAHLAMSATTARARMIWTVAASILLLNIALVTTGRSGYVVLIVCSCVLLMEKLFTSERRLGFRQVFAVLAGGLAIVLLLIASPVSRDRIALGFKEVKGVGQATEGTSMGLRVIFWENTLQLIQERPLLGYGTGSFAAAYKSKVAGGSGFRAMETGDPHNQYMKIAVENGIAGLMLFIGFLLSVFFTKGSERWRVLTVGVLLSWCITSLFNAHFTTFAEGHFLYLWVGAMISGRLVFGKTSHVDL